MDRRIKLINDYVARLTQGKINALQEIASGVFRVDFRAGTAKIEVEVHQQQDVINIRSTLFEISQVQPNDHHKLFEELLRNNSAVETMSAKFGLTADNFIEVVVSRKDLKDLDYSEFLSALKNVCSVADVKGGEITARYLLGVGGEMDITPLDD